MRYTNKLGLPMAMVKAVERDEHRQADFSVTQMLKGATEIALERMFPDKLEMDVADAVNMMLGSAVHKLFEEQGTDFVLNEHYMEADVYAGFKVSGKADVLNLANEECVDYKTCASWKVIYKDFDDWRRQGKGYLWLWFMETGNLWHKARFIALIKDWSPTEAKHDRNYPQSPIVPIRFEYSDAEIFGVQEEWTEKIVEVLQMLVSQDFGCCSAEERWAKPTQWALMKEGNKKALKLYDNEADAIEAKGDDSKLYVEERKGRDVKCESYCVAGKCGLCPYRNAKENGND